MPPVPPAGSTMELSKFFKRTLNCVEPCVEARTPWECERQCVVEKLARLLRQLRVDAAQARGTHIWKGCHSCGQYPSLVPYRRAGRLVGLAMSASRSSPSSTPPGDDCGRTMHRICKRVPWCESILAPVAHRLKRFKIDGAEFRSDHLHDSSSDVLSRTVSLSLPNAIATQRGIARTQAQRWTCSAAHELQVHR